MITCSAQKGTNCKVLGGWCLQRAFGWRTSSALLWCSQPRCSAVPTEKDALGCYTPPGCPILAVFDHRAASQHTTPHTRCYHAETKLSAASTLPTSQVSRGVESSMCQDAVRSRRLGGARYCSSRAGNQSPALVCRQQVRASAKQIDKRRENWSLCLSK